MSQKYADIPLPEEKKRPKSRIRRHYSSSRVLSPPNEYDDNRSSQDVISPVELAEAQEISIIEPADDRLKACQYAHTKSHDILNHNQVAMGFMEMAMEHINPESDTHFMLNRAYNALRRSSILAQGVHSISRSGHEQCTKLTGSDSPVR